MDKIDFCRNFVHLAKKPIRFDGRQYLEAIYGSQAPNLVIRASRQVEKSTFLVNSILYEAWRRPNTQILFVAPRLEQARLFSKSRLLPALNDSPVVRRWLLGSKARRPAVMDLQFVNGSGLYVRAAYHSADAVRGISADVLMIDEFQDVAAGDLPVLQETLSHSKMRKTILTGTPKSVDNHLDAIFRQSTANEWSLDCTNCRQVAILDERVLGTSGIVCPSCQAALDPRFARWIPRNPQAGWGDGFWISHLMVPWIHYDDVLRRQREYDPVRFKNEVLGLPTTLGEHIVTLAELEACCGDAPMATTVRDIPRWAQGHLIAGLDWGGGTNSRTVLVLGAMTREFVFQVFRFERFTAREEPNRILAEVSQRCREFQVRWIAADGAASGRVYNRMLLDQLRRQEGLLAVFYSTTDHEPIRDGILFNWTVNRSATIGALFSRVKKRSIVFPRRQEVGSFLDEFACEVAEYDDQQRAVCYSHPDTQLDDALHATNYALIAAVREYYARSRPG